MKKLAALLLCTSGLMAAQYETCIILTQSGSVICMHPQSKQGAELEALAYNAAGSGQVIAWARRAPKGKNKYKPHTDSVHPAPAIELPSQPQTN